MFSTAMRELAFERHCRWLPIPALWLGAPPNALPAPGGPARLPMRLLVLASLPMLKLLALRAAARSRSRSPPALLAALLPEMPPEPDRLTVLPPPPPPALLRAGGTSHCTTGTPLLPQQPVFAPLRPGSWSGAGGLCVPLVLAGSLISNGLMGELAAWSRCLLPPCCCCCCRWCCCLRRVRQTRHTASAPASITVPAPVCALFGGNCAHRGHAGAQWLK